MAKKKSKNVREFSSYVCIVSELSSTSVTLCLLGMRREKGERTSVPCSAKSAIKNIDKNEAVVSQSPVVDFTSERQSIFTFELKKESMVFTLALVLAYFTTTTMSEQKEKKENR